MSDPFDIFEGEDPTIWFSMVFEDIVHPAIPQKARIRTSLGINHSLMGLLIRTAVDAGMSIHEVFHIGRSADATRTFMQAMLNFGADKDGVRRFIDATIQFMEKMMEDSGRQHVFLAHFFWYEQGCNTVVLGPNMVGLLEHTDLPDILLSDVKFPYNDIYVALPGFDGKLLDYTSGYHYTRGINILNLKSIKDHHRSIGGPVDIAFTLWGKPKFHPEVGYDDMFVYSGITDCRLPDLVDQPEKLTELRDPESWGTVQRCARIAFNLLAYWEKNRLEPNKRTREVEHRIAQLKGQIETAKRRKKKRKLKSLNKALDYHREAFRKGGKVYFLERPDSDFVSDVPKRTVTNRKSPRFHIRSGHYRLYRKGKKDEYHKWVEPTEVCKGNGSLPPRLWRSQLDQKKDKKK